jgi:hypothetical protein
MDEVEQRTVLEIKCELEKEVRFCQAEINEAASAITRTLTLLVPLNFSQNQLLANRKFKSPLS